jgi:hypothetical protein
VSRFPENDRKKAREERLKNTTENIARIKQRMRDGEQQRDRQHRFQPFAIAAMSAAVAVVGYLAYRYML